MGGWEEGREGEREGRRRVKEEGGERQKEKRKRKPNAVCVAWLCIIVCMCDSECFSLRLSSTSCSNSVILF